jgi:hypothetical protein
VNANVAAIDGFLGNPAVPERAPSARNTPGIGKKNRQGYANHPKNANDKSNGIF